MIVDEQTCRIWKEKLDNLCIDLHALSTSTENEFLSIGADLNNFYARAWDISKMSSSLVSSMSETELAMVVASFRDLLDRMNHYIREAESGFRNGTEILNDINQSIDNIYRPMASFKKIVKILRILSISTKIESAQINNYTNGFVTIADDVEKLATLIQFKFADIISSAESLKTSIEQTHRRISLLKNKRGDKDKTILESTRATLTLLAQKNELSSRTARKISAELESVSGNIGEVVASMQFHDITRQQVEHVEEALHKVSIGLADENPDIEKIIQETGIVCELQKAQLADAQEKFTHAVGSIMDNLTGIADNIAELCEDVKKVAGTEDEVSSSFFLRIESGVSSMMSSLRENNEAIRELYGTMENLIKTVGSMSQFVSDIEDISMEIELIALNARVKSAHTGSEGAPLGVIAEAIQKLSVDVRIQKTEISDELQKIISKAESLHQNINASTQEQTTETGSMLSDLNTLTERLRITNETITALLKKIEKGGRELANHINNTLSGIHVNDLFTGRINKVLSVLDSIVSEALELMPGMDFQMNVKTLKHMENKYTMQSERRIHHSHAIIDPNRGIKRYVEKNSIPSEKDLGDNVELF
ncbi:MAG: methyl-accepting chemotaxis protein [Syntrophorhabdus sp.]|jgi:methyl-accepting chemotaxis protein|nr:methyl-accepting chemotaxis protein [Syntrophorhabdus sp.]OQC53003.1 MAG: Methyl-accepting chemotaxis protein (MCP) signaling domain protein [Deltaproteobacteria bacterium ADurb.Bin026]